MWNTSTCPHYELSPSSVLFFLNKMCLQDIPVCMTMPVCRSSGCNVLAKFYRNLYSSIGVKAADTQYNILNT